MTNRTAKTYIAFRRLYDGNVEISIDRGDGGVDETFELCQGFRDDLIEYLAGQQGKAVEVKYEVDRV